MPLSLKKLIKKVKSDIEEFCSSVESNNADIISYKLQNIFQIKPVKPCKNTKKKDKLWLIRDVIKNEMK